MAITTKNIPVIKKRFKKARIIIYHLKVFIYSIISYHMLLLKNFFIVIQNVKNNRCSAGQVAQIFIENL